MVDVVRVDVESNDEVEWKKSRVVGTLSGLVGGWRVVGTSKALKP